MPQGYTFINRKGQDKPPVAMCRVCGSPKHECSYNKPTMECIEYLRAEIQVLKTKEATKVQGEM